MKRDRCVVKRDVTLRLIGMGRPEGEHWVQQLTQMYAAWARRQGYVVQEAFGELNIRGPGARQQLEKEVGAHHCIRVDPTDLQRRRCTTFVHVVLDDEELEEKPFIVRSYIADPQERVSVTDHRTKVTTPEFAEVMNGKLELLQEARSESPDA